MSCYIRPLFLLPFCYFAYKRSIWGITFTLLALATSMFWFPEPEWPDPRAVEFLVMEKEYLVGDWMLAKVRLGLLVPVRFAALALAFWRRSLLYGLVVIDAVMLTKIAWSFYYGGGSGLALLPPTLVSPIARTAVVHYVAYRACGRLSLRPHRPAVPV